MLLELKDINIHYGVIHAVKGATIAIEEKSIVTLIGSNGAGKTTILKTISGLISVTSGEIWMDGKRIDRSRPDQIIKAGIAHVPEGRRVFPNMSVLENLEMGAFSRSSRHDVSRDLNMILETFPRLKERSAQHAGCLSGGEQQMLAVGRAMMAEPRLLLMDEPSLGLSPLMVDEIERIVRDLNNTRNMSILLVEQNARMAFRLSKRGYVIETGKIVMEGDAESLANDEQVKKAYLGM